MDYELRSRAIYVKNVISDSVSVGKIDEIMNFSLYDALVPNWIQQLGAIFSLIEKAENHCKDKVIIEEELIYRSLAPDMYPFGYQVKSALTHSIGSIEAIRNGFFCPDRSPWSKSFAALRDQVDLAKFRLSEIDPGEINDFAGRDVRFEAGAYKAVFLAEDFLLSFAQPNFYFHCAIAYGILRAEGVTIGKVDFLGTMRQKA